MKNQRLVLALLAATALWLCSCKPDYDAYFKEKLPIKIEGYYRQVVAGMVDYKVLNLDIDTLYKQGEMRWDYKVVNSCELFDGRGISVYRSDTFDVYYFPKQSEIIFNEIKHFPPVPGL